MPFKAAIDAGVATIMTAHVLVPSLDEQRPATLSRRIVSDLLRDELHYDGVILSDDLEMKAIAAGYAVPEAAVLAIEAGCDGVLICSGDHATQAAALEALIHAVEAGAAPVRARRGRTEAPAARQGAVPDVAGRGQAGGRAGPARRARPRRASRHRRRDGALPVMLKPRALAPGDRLAIVAPASPFTREEFDRGLQEIRRLGFEPVYDDSVFARQRYVAGSAAVRAAAIHAAWRDPSIAGLIGVRGGYGSAQVLPLLDRDEARRAAQAVHRLQRSHVDADVSHARLRPASRSTARCWPAGSAAARPATTATRSCRRSAGREPLGELAPAGLETIRPGEAAGMLLGGTLTQLLASLATPFAFDPPAGYVLFLDEVGERPYRLDRMVTQLRAGRAAGARGRRRHRRAAEVRRAIRRSDGARRHGRSLRRLSRSGR